MSLPSQLRLLGSLCSACDWELAQRAKPQSYARLVGSCSAPAALQQTRRLASVSASASATGFGPSPVPSRQRADARPVSVCPAHAHVIAVNPTDLTDSLSLSSIPHRHRRGYLPSTWPIHRLESAIPTRSPPRIPGASQMIRRRAAGQPVSPTRRTRACARNISHRNSDTNQPTNATEE